MGLWPRRKLEFLASVCAVVRAPGDPIFAVTICTMWRFVAFFLFALTSAAASESSHFETSVLPLESEEVASACHAALTITAPELPFMRFGWSTIGATMYTTFTLIQILWPLLAVFGLPYCYTATADTVHHAQSVCGNQRPSCTRQRQGYSAGGSPARALSVPE